MSCTCSMISLLACLVYSRGKVTPILLEQDKLQKLPDINDTINMNKHEAEGLAKNRESFSTQMDWLKVNPWGIRNILAWVKEHYNDPIIYITESGRPSGPGLEDPERIYYYKYYINEMLKAIKLDGVRVHGYTAWSLMDNLEWTTGYAAKFGLYSVDFDSPSRTRIPRVSASFFRNLTIENGFEQPDN